ncbi:MAG TPA: glycosyltransferase [Microbacteriaceae bacterium]
MTVAPPLPLVTVLPAGVGVAAELNTALAPVTSDYVLLVEPSATLSPDAVEVSEAALRRFPETDLVYGDSTDAAGKAMLQRPIFSPVRLRGQDYLGGARVFRTERLRALGGFREGFDGVHGYDLTLRFAAAGATVLHIPSPLSESSDATGLAIARRGDRPQRDGRFADAAALAVRDHLEAIGVAASIEPQQYGGFRLRYPIIGEPLVSLVIPTRGSSATIAGRNRVLIVDAVRGILEKSTYANIEIVVVVDDDTPQAVIDELVEIAGERLRLARWSAPFNFSAKINRGALCASGDYLVPLNDDVELITPDWIEVMLGLAQQPQIGLVGTTLFFEDGTLQHAGHLYRDGGAGHIGLGWQPDWDDRLDSLSVDREVSGVTAACAMLSTETFWRVGGFSTLLPGNYNDADLSLKIRRTGESVVWTPHARLYHFESKSRVATIAPSELVTIQGRWGSEMQLDPYWP